MALEVQAQRDAVAKVHTSHGKAKAELCELTARFAEEKRLQAIGPEAAAVVKATAPASMAEMASVQCLLSCLAAADPQAVLGPACSSREELEAHTVRLRGLHDRLSTPAPADTYASKEQLEKMQELQARLEEARADAADLQRQWADMEDDLGSDSESVATALGPEQAEAKKQKAERKAERCKMWAAKRSRFGTSIGKVNSKFGGRCL